MAQIDYKNGNVNGAHKVEPRHSVFDNLQSNQSPDTLELGEHL
jgi:hypothetical protein